MNGKKIVTSILLRSIIKHSATVWSFYSSLWKKETRYVPQYKTMLMRIERLSLVVCLIAFLIIHTSAYASSILWARAWESIGLIKDEEYMVEAQDADTNPLLLTVPDVDGDEDDTTQPAEEIDGLEIIFEEPVTEQDGPDDEETLPEVIIVYEEEPELMDIVAEDTEIIEIPVEEIELEETVNDEIQEP